MGLMSADEVGSRTYTREDGFKLLDYLNLDSVIVARLSR